MDARAHLFGVRHHGPGSAASLVAALDHLDPVAVLIEGPSDANDLLRFAALPGMQPPIALLVHAAEEPSLASFFPFASFSPEWRALLWALKRERPVRFIDWPAATALAVRKERHAAHAPERSDAEPATPAAHADPLEVVAQMSGHSDGEAFWNAFVESTGSGPDIFPVIEAAMTELRNTDAHNSALVSLQAEDDDRREAFMRLEIRQAQKDVAGAIAVVTGAWHVPALRADRSVPADRALVRGLPKLEDRGDLGALDRAAARPGERLWRGHRLAGLVWSPMGTKRSRRQMAGSVRFGGVVACQGRDAAAGGRIAGRHGLGHRGGPDVGGALKPARSCHAGTCGDARRYPRRPLSWR